MGVRERRLVAPGLPDPWQRAGATAHRPERARAVRAGRLHDGHARAGMVMRQRRMAAAWNADVIRRARVRAGDSGTNRLCDPGPIRGDWWRPVYWRRVDS